MTSMFIGNSRVVIPHISAILCYVYMFKEKDRVVITDVAIIVLCGVAVPYQPLNLHAEAISPNEIVVKWDAPQEADSIISYELYYNDSHTRQNVSFSIHPPVSSYRLEDLTPDTVYHIQVSAKSSRGEGPRTPTVQVKTHAFGMY